MKMQIKEKKKPKKEIVSGPDSRITLESLVLSSDVVVRSIITSSVGASVINKPSFPAKRKTN